MENFDSQTTSFTLINSGIIPPTTMGEMPELYRRDRHPVAAVVDLKENLVIRRWCTKTFSNSLETSDSKDDSIN